MKMHAIRLLCAASLAASGAAAQAQVKYTPAEIVGRIAECMKESAPKDWKRLIFTLDQQSPDPENPGKIVASHKAVVGKADSAPRDIKPCRRPDWVSRAVQTFRESQNEKERGWTGVTITMESDGRYSATFRYPK
jgi:hypothetical protein